MVTLGWYGAFLVPKLKLVFYLRSIDENVLGDRFDSLDEFFGKYDKLMEDINYIEETSEESRHFSAKTTAKMFNVVDSMSSLPEYVHNEVFLLYFVKKCGFEISYRSEGKAELEKLEKKGWKVIG